MCGRFDPGSFCVPFLRSCEGSVDQRIDFAVVIDADIVDPLPCPFEPRADGYPPILRAVPIWVNGESVEEIPRATPCGLWIEQGVVLVSRETYQLYVYSSTTHAGLDALSVQRGGPEQGVSHFQGNPVRIPGSY